jgi:hypothetical protein
MPVAQKQASSAAGTRATIEVFADVTCPFAHVGLRIEPDLEAVAASLTACFDENEPDGGDRHEHRDTGWVR